MSSTRTNLTAYRTPQFSVLSEDQKESIFNGVIETLQRTGLDVRHEGARDLLKEHGCLIDGSIVKIPPQLVRKSLLTVPPVTVIYNWDGSGKIRVEKNRVYFGPGPTNPNFIDPETMERRKYLKKDPSIVAKVCDALPNIGFVQSLGSISDVTESLADVYEFAEMITNTAKPIMSWAFSRETCRDIHKIAIAMAGGEEKFKRRPNYIYYGEPISPLLSDFNAMDKVMYCAENRIPQVYTPCCIGGATVPATHAGQLVCAMSESMLGVVVSQLINPGTCVIMGGVQSILDMQYSVYAYGAPELSLLSAALTEMAKYVGLPMFSTAGCTDAKTMDSQAAIEATLSIHSAMLSGPNFVHDVGYTESGMTGSVFQLTLGDEIIGMSRLIAGGVEINEETMAVKEICNVGPGGHYLYENHTMKHFRSHWQPTLMDRKSFEDWEEDGSTTMKDRIIKKVRNIIATHKGPEVPEEAKKKINEILQAAEKREKKKVGAK